MRLKNNCYILCGAIIASLISLKLVNSGLYFYQNKLTKSTQFHSESSLQLSHIKSYQSRIINVVLNISSPTLKYYQVQKEIQRLTNGLNQSLLNSKTTQDSLNIQKDIDEIEQVIVDFNQAVDRYLTDFLLSSPIRDRQRIGFESLESLTNRQKLIDRSDLLTRLLDRAIASEQVQLKQKQIIIQQISSGLFYLNVTFCFLGSTLALFVAVFFSKKVADPFSEMTAIALSLKEDDRLEKDRKDEIEVLNQSLHDIFEKFQQINESKLYVDKIIRNINDALIVLDSNYKVKDFNFATLLMLGYEEEELLGQSIEKVFIDATACDEILGVDRPMANSFLGTKETIFVTKERRNIPVSLSASIMWDSHDRVEGIVCLVQDISAHKQAMETLRRQALMFETIHDGILLTDLDGNMIDCNPAAERVFGYSKEKMIGQMMGKLRYPSAKFGEEGNEAWYLTQQIIDAVLRRGRWTGELRFIREDGTSGICETVVVPLRDRDNKLIATIGVNRDITERKKAEEALRQSEERLESILNSLNDIVWSMEIESKKILYLNPAIAKVYGRSVEEFFEQPSLWFDAIHSDDRQRVIDFSAELFATRERNLEYRIVRPDGEVRWIHDRGKLIGDADKQSLRFEGIATDITEQKQAQHLLEQTQIQLEERVAKRTAELKANNDILLSEIRDRVAAETALRESEAKYKQLARQEALVNQLTEQIRNSLDLSTILKTTVEQIRTLLSVDRCVFIWYRQTDNESWWEVVAEAKHHYLPSILGEYPANVSEVLTQKIRNLEILREENLAVATDPHLQTIYQTWRYQAILALPIQTHTGDIGLVSCGNFRRIKPWSDADVALLQLITNQLAIALFQAELYAKAQTSAQDAHERAEELKYTLQKLQKTQAQLIQSEKMSSLGQLVAGVAHEINNPVNFISGNIHFVQDYTQDLLDLLDLYETNCSVTDEEMLEAIEDYELDFLRQDLPKLLSSMNTGANRIREIVLSLRNFSRLDEANYKSVDLHEGIENSLLILKHRLNGQTTPNKYSGDRSSIQVIKDYGNLPHVQCFASLLNQVFMNILSNAIDALDTVSGDPSNGKPNSPAYKSNLNGNSRLKSNPNGLTSSKECHSQAVSVDLKPQEVAAESTGLKHPTIHISTNMTEGDRVVIRIKDNGAGMTETVRQRMFDPFFTTKPVGSGTGLGLSISYQIVVEQHHGDLSCISELGLGTELRIELPVHQ